ncbi:MAG: efflux RND transporter permease subunit [Bacteroidota bacterium]
MRKIVATFIKYPFYANLVVGILLLAGLLSLFDMKMSFFPERKSRFIHITVAYPGASPKEMEEGVTTRIEEAVRGIVGIKEITSTSSENVSRVSIETTGDYDLDETLQEVKNSVDGISSFPSAAERPIVYKQRTTTSAMFMGLVADNVDMLTIKRHAQTIEDDLMTSGIMSQVNIGGYPPIEISVEAREDVLLRYNLTFDEISRAITLNNRDFSGGQIKSDEEEILIRARERSVEPEEIGDIILRANADGSFLRIRDVADVKMKFADVSNRGLMNGKPAAFIFVSKLATEDLQAISEFINNYAEEFNARHPGVNLEITYDFLDILKARLNLLIKNGGIGLLLVLISLGLFLSFRLSLWVAWGIPASFLGMFIIANVYGITINMISLFGMILVVGILVDDGIVIAENIYSHFEKGKTPRQAAIDGTMEVLPAVFTSVLTTIIAFSPLLFLQDSMEMMFEMAFVVIASLAFSLIEAFFVLPAHVASPHILRSKRRQSLGNKIRFHLERAINYMKLKIYGRILKLMIRWRWAAVWLPITLILLTVGLLNATIIKSTFFPAIPFDQFSINIAFTPGSGEKRTMDYLMRFDEAVWEVNEQLRSEYRDWLQSMEDTSDFIAYTFLSLGSAFDGVESGAHAGNINVLLRNMEGSPISSFDINTRVRAKIGPIPEAEKFTVGGRNRWGAPVSISLLGKNLEEMDKAEVFMMNELEKFDELNNIVNNNAAGKREIRLALKPKAYMLGLDHSSISNQVRQGFFGGQAQRLQHGKDEIRIWVRYPKDNRENIGQLEHMKIKTPQGDYPLIELVDYHIERGPVNIQRFNMSREIRIDADLVDPYTPVPPILERIDNNILPELKAQFPGVRVVYQGQKRRSEESTAELGKFFLIAFGIIVVILMIHFKSFGQGLIIIMMIPLAWLGSSWGHGIEGIPVSILSAWGMVALSGVIINDAVVFLSKYNLNLREGLKVKDAVYQAGLSRFRPIILTTITTVIGLYPLILEGSFQAQFLIPMAVALAYGVLIGTGFILIFFPVLILTLNDARVKATQLWTGHKPTPEEVEKAVKHMKREEV